MLYMYIYIDVCVFQFISADSPRFTFSTRQTKIAFENCPFGSVIFVVKVVMVHSKLLVYRRVTHFIKLYIYII